LGLVIFIRLSADFWPDQGCFPRHVQLLRSRFSRYNITLESD
jgi:hypothetical protein